ncbi:tetratricopeptide repeat protein [Paraburkholderia sp. PREW-6R]|uniref:tetratricopeptide repeat protein n=1 Tax=Paraburkholderia sp. PREW-6R TaxID=3141544 RepID=UPI0031F4FB1C
MVDSFPARYVTRGVLRGIGSGAALAALIVVGACASKEGGYGVGAQAERAVVAQQTSHDAVPDTPGMYLGLIDQMQSQGLYYASLAHIDAYEKQYGATPETVLLRADALRMTQQPAAAATAYEQLLKTPLAARGYRGLGLLAGAAGDFGRAAQALQQASELAPTDAVTLSDLGYARLRNGDVDGARVPLMQAGQLDQNNRKIVSNVVLFLLCSGKEGEALAVMNQQKLAPEVRTAIRSDAAKVVAAKRAQTRGGQFSSAPPSVTPQQPGEQMRAMASAQGGELSPRVLQRFAR